MKKQKKILILCWRDPQNPKAGGAEYVTLKHAQAWVKAGHSVTWLAAHIAGQPAAYTQNGISFVRFGTEKLFFLTVGLQYFLQTKRDFDVIIDQVHGLPNFSAVWAPRTYKILLIHEVAGKIWEYMFSWPVSAIGQFLESFFLRVFYRSTQAWVDAVSTKNDLIAVGFDSKKVAVIPCAIADAPILKEAKNNTLTLLFLARLVPMKGVEYALKVFKYVLKLEPAAQLIIAGSGEAMYLQKLKRLSALLKIAPAVKFVGKVSEVEKKVLLRKSHFLLHTSVKEGFGLTVLEANQQATPAAIFDVGSLNELVEDGKTGVIAPFHHEQLLAQKIVVAFQNKAEYRTLSTAASLFQKRYNWDTFVAMSTALVEET